MKAKVIKAFIDKKTGKAFNVGYLFDGAGARIKELTAKGFLKAEVAKDDSKLGKS